MHAGAFIGTFGQFLDGISAIFHSPYIALIFLAALAFDFVNGFHDAANSIATVVGTRVLRPFPAVFWAATWNFLAAWFFGVHVANTVAKWVHADYVTTEVIFAGLLGAIIWDLITWYWGLPTSSSHALLGGFGGAAVVHAGKWSGVLYDKKVLQTVEFIVIAPFIGLALGLFFMTVLMWALRRTSPSKVDRHFRVIQLASAAAYSLGHGTNDAQKTAGIIAALLYASIWKTQQADFAAGKLDFPFWIVVLCNLAIGLGTMAGGWRIVKTMGMKITKLRPHGGACAETAAAISLFTTAKLGIPVSTTHTITGAIVGVGSVRRFSAVRWGIARRVVWAWVFTIPASAVMAVISYYVITAIHNH
jgi:PiT family inorganic phosphate transporter